MFHVIERLLEFVSMSSTDLLRAASKKLLTVRAAEASAAAEASGSPNPDDRGQIQLKQFWLEKTLEKTLKF